MVAVYDLAGNLDQITYPDGRVVTQTFDAAGRLATSSSGGANYISNVSYTPAGAEQSFTLGNGVTQTNSYNHRLQPTRSFANSPALPSVPAGSGNVLDREAIYASGALGFNGQSTPPTNNGNIQAIVDNLNVGWTQSFSYDGLNRLQTASRSDGGYNHTYQYDSFGNMIPQDNLHGNPPLGIDQATNRIVLGTGGYTYDAAGQQISWPALCGGSHTNWYTAEGFLRSIDSYYTGSYLYNGQGQRTLAVRDNASWTEYVYLGGQPMAEIDNTGTWTDYIYANGQKIAKVSSPGATTYYLDDHLGTTQMELDASGNVLWQGQFTPFGMELDSGATAMHYKFTGKERDTESGLDKFGARFYTSVADRFMSPDPKQITKQRMNDPQQWNMYSYVRNNPMVAIDPDGKELRFANLDQAKQGREAARGGVDPSQRRSITYEKSGDHYVLKVDADTAKAAGAGSNLGRLASVTSDTTKVAQVNFVKGGDAVSYDKAGVEKSTTLNQQGADGLTLFSHGDSNINVTSATPGVTQTFINTESGDENVTFGHEVEVHVADFFKTDSPTQSSHPAVDGEVKQVEGEVKKNETKVPE